MAAMLCTCGKTLAEGETICATCATQDFVAASGQSSIAESNAAAPGGEVAVPGYEILSVLGRGGMGVVYKARQKSLDRLVALKMIRDADLAGADTLARFQQEAEALARLQHANIVQIHEIGSHQGRPYFALEYVPGGSLAQRVRGTPLVPRQAAETVAILARAVHAAHQVGIVHRDLKPLNVLIAADGTLKIADFGLAKKLDDEHSAAGLTRSDAIVGTPSYMAPEQIQSGGEKLGPAADVYALGAVLYECLTGQPPFRADNMMDTLHKVLTEDPVPPSRLRPNVPADLQAICLRCLEKQPPSRYASALALADDLQRFLEGRPTMARPIGPAARAVRWVRRRPVVAGFSFALLLLAVGTAAALLAWWHESLTRKEGEAASETKLAQTQTEADRTLLEEKKRSEQKVATVQKQREVDKLQQAYDAMAKNVLTPLGHREGPPAAAELAVLRDLAANPIDEVRLRFMERALADPATARRVARRSELVVQAAVGLSKQRRDRFRELVRGKLRDAHPEIREACLLLGVDLGLAQTDEAFRMDGAKIALETMATETDPFALARLGRAYAALGVSPRDSPEHAATFIVDALLKEKEAQSLAALNAALMVLSSADVPASLAEKHIARLLEAMQVSTEPECLVGLGGGVHILSGRLEPERASEVAADAFARIMKVALPLARDKGADPAIANELAWALVPLAHKLPSAAAEKFCRELVLTVNRQSIHPATLAGFGRVLHAAGGRVATDNDRTGMQMVGPHLMMGMMIKSTDANVKKVLARELSEMVADFPPKSAATLISICMASQGVTDPIALAEISRAVEALSGKLDEETAARGVHMKFGLLSAGVAKPLNPHNAASAARTVEILVPRTAPSIATSLAVPLPNIIAATMVNSKDAYSLAAQVRVLSALTRHGDKKFKTSLSGDLSRRFLEALQRTSDPYFVCYLSRAIVALSNESLEAAPEPKAYAAAAGKIADAMARSNDARAIIECAQTLSVLMPNIESEARTAALDSACKRLQHVMADFAEPRDLVDLLQAVKLLVDGSGDKQKTPIVMATLAGLLDVMAAHPEFSAASRALVFREMESLSELLATDDIIALLKHSTCLADGRAVLLRTLSRRLGAVPELYS